MLNWRMRVKVLIVDDEPLARERIRTLLRSEPDVEVVGECSNGRQAVTAIRKLQPDLLFLDVQMPEMDGFGVLQATKTDSMPAVIFVTAYDKYALKAFEVHAQDYLLKPFDRERFTKALRRVKMQHEQIQKDKAEGGTAGALAQRLLALLEDLKSNGKYLDRLVVKSGGRVLFLRTEEIEWIQAEGNYVRLHLGPESHLLRDTMNALQARLDPKRFVRVHRSTLVNLERIKEIHPMFRGEYVVILHDGARLTLSRGYRQRLQERLGKAF
jgi:two-component system LytT family response regulator